MSVQAQPQGAVRPGRGRRFFDALDERLGLRSLAYPVPEHANRLAYSLGGLSVVAFLSLLVSGVALAQFYDPEPATAHASVRRVITDVTMGSYLRGFHYWMAMAMVVLVGLHLLRVFVSGSFKRREGNWIIGVALAGFTAIFFFSGTVLKDQESLEALEHNIEIGRLLGRFGYWPPPSSAASRSCTACTRCTSPSFPPSSSWWLRPTCC